MRRFLVPLIERECAAARHVRIGEAGGQLQRFLTGALRLDQVVFFCAIPLVKSGMHHRQSGEGWTVAGVQLDGVLKHFSAFLQIWLR